jgi:hypothetical protein
MTTKRPGSLPFPNPVGDSLELMKKMWGFAGLPGIATLPNAGNLASMASRIPQQLPSMFAPTLDVNELEKRIADLRAVEQWLELNASILRTTIQSLEVQRATIATLKGISSAMMAPMSATSETLPKLPPNPPPEVALGLEAMKVEESSAARAASPAGTRKKSKPAITPLTTRSEAVADPLNPAAWWNTLQEQFAKIASSNPPAAPDAAKKKATKSRRKRG